MFHRFVHAVISRRSAVAVMLASAAFMAVLSGPPAFAQGTPPVPAADLASPGAVAREGYALTPPAAEALEATLRTDPNDLAARAKLLGFYFRQSGRTVARDVAIEARRGHILWLIENRPASAVLGLSEATIDKAGHALADPAGFAQVAAAWTEQATRKSGEARVLGNAARFFLLSDKERAAAFLRQAQRVEPDNPEWRARLGQVLALAILGVDMMNQNGLPTSHDAAEARSTFALHTIDELTRSTDATVVGIAGMLIGQQGLMMSAMHRDKFTVDHIALSDRFLARARELEPQNSNWSTVVEQLRSLRATRDQRK